MEHLEYAPEELSLNPFQGGKRGMNLSGHQMIIVFELVLSTLKIQQE